MAGGFSGRFGTDNTIGWGFGVTNKQPNANHTVASVVVSTTSIAGEPGQVVTFTATAKNASGSTINGKTYSAISADPTKVRVDSVVGRLVTLSILQQTAGITVTVSCEGHDAPAVTVSGSWILATLSLATSPATVPVGSSINLTATAKNRFGLTMPTPTLVGTSSAVSVATVGSISGSTVPVTGVKAGTSSIRVKNQAGTIQSNAVAIDVVGVPVTHTLTSYRVIAGATSPASGGAVPVTAQALDENGNPMAASGKTITWSLDTGTGGSFGSPTSVTDASGLASVVFTVNTTPGTTYRVRATDGDSKTGVSGDFTVAGDTQADLVIGHGGALIASFDDLPASLEFLPPKIEDYGDAQYEGGTVSGDVIPAYGAAWDAGNTTAWYDWAIASYQLWVMTGDAKWKTRADAMVLDVYTRYVAPNGNNPSPHYNPVDSMYQYYLLNGDTAIRDACVAIASHHLAFYENIDNLGKDWLENRVQTRVMLAWWIAEKILGVGADVGNGTQTYTAVLDDAIARVLAMQNANGSWTFPLSTCGFSLNYMSALLADFLTRIYDQRPKSYNAAIQTAMVKLADFLWNTQWRGVSIPGDNSFNYLSGLCTGTGGPSRAPDLNGFIAVLFAWLYKRTGDAAYKTKAEAVLGGLETATNESWYLRKQFTEGTSPATFRALGYLYGA